LWMHQVLYEPVGKGTKVKRAAIKRILDPDDIVSWDEGYIAGVTDLAMRRGWPPIPSVRYCTTYFKVQLVNTWIVCMQQEWQADTVIVALGERAAESPRRAKRSFCMLRPKSQRKTYRAINWMPIQHWSRRQVFRKMRDHGIEPHPCYKAQGMTDRDMYDRDMEGGPRTSCRFCIYATHADCCHQALVLANQGICQRIAQVEDATFKTWWMNRSIKEYSPHMGKE
ncbi:MAG: phosphoadenosine phosphosulfate reductase family protein, partial [Anaerolineae bacterium]